jgi:predicted transcriptional regulator
MPAGRLNITDAELDVLKQLWDAATELTVREITLALYGDPSPSNLATVQKLLQRLEAKQCVGRDRSSHAHAFVARVTPEAVAGAQLDALAQKVTGGSMLPFISHLVDKRRLSRREKEEIRRLLDEKA